MRELYGVADNILQSPKEEFRGAQRKQEGTRHKVGGKDVRTEKKEEQSAWGKDQ